MDSVTGWITYHWQRKCVAVLAAFVVWIFVNHSITTVKTIPQVPIRVLNLPAGKTIPGLLPNGILKKRVTLALSGTKNVVEQVEPGDIEVQIDVSNNPDDWILQINKKNLVSLNPEIDLLHHVTQVDHNEFVVKMSRLITANIPVKISKLAGDPPQNYQFLDIWPKELTHTISGPEEEVQQLQNKGLELTFNLNEITKADLEALESSHSSQKNDEISYSVPSKWKQVAIPFRNHAIEEINDVDAQRLHINFLRQELIPLPGEIPIRIFQPTRGAQHSEPLAFSPNEIIEKRKEKFFFTLPLYAAEVSQTFLDTVKDHIEINVVVDNDNANSHPIWSVDFINPHELENRYVTSMLNHYSLRDNPHAESKRREEHLRARFREYMQKFALYVGPENRLELNCKCENAIVHINTISTPIILNDEIN